MGATPPFSRLQQLQRHFSTMNAQELKNFLADSPPSVVRLEIKKHFEALSDKEKRYAHYISQAAVSGIRIVLRQVSPEAEHIYDFIVELYNSCDGDWSAAQKKAGVSDEDLKYFLEYAACFLGNLGNYKSFGDVKFIPRCDAKVFEALATLSSKAKKHYDAINGAIFPAAEPGLMHLGFPEDGHLTTYYPDSPTIKKSEIAAVGEFLESKGMLVENTRLRKTSDGTFELLLASAVTEMPSEGSDMGKETDFTIENGPLKGSKVKLVFGDYSKELQAVAENCRKAAENAANDTQKDLFTAYAKSFETGSSAVFKDSQRFWIRDKGPMVESNIGFIETMRDPQGVRAEFEGFVAMVNAERTRAFGALVNAAESLIPKLPWPADFEKDKFLSPDFTSLEVLTFISSGLPAGINIPNYDDIRQSEGFKNVSLGNVISAKAPNEKIPFIRDEDLEVFQKYRDDAFEVQVAVHELLGHGSGKLLQETEPGVYNFDIKNPPTNPLTGKPVATWYKPGQTWGSVFGSIASSYEECRAEAIAMALSCDFEILKIFGHGDGTEDMDGEAGSVLYASYLSMARMGIGSLEVWDPKSRKWGQAHSQARFSILKCFLEAPEEFCTLKYTKPDLSDLTINVKRELIPTVGRKAVETYLQKLHIYKATADVETATKMYTEMTYVEPEFWGEKVRNEVLRNKQPRKVFVQAKTTLDEASGKVAIEEYEPTCEGMIKSYVEKNV
ncbi:putative dipeptidylpeptidase III protein [Rutstroemia sp. NJR-2017a WRK4]|nr:putative dipeptidylpeptidase III protein [Rutstroemia sp. NJR-2017a WRK4]